MFCGWLLLMIYQSTDVCLFGDSAQVQKVFKGYSELSNHKQQTKSKGAVHQDKKHDTNNKIMSILKDPN